MAQSPFIIHFNTLRYNTKLQMSIHFRSYVKLGPTQFGPSPTFSLRVE